MFAEENYLVGTINSLKFELAGQFYSAIPWQHLPRINHNYELFIGIKETLYLTIEDQHLTIAPGDVLLIPPGIHFSGQKDSPGGLSFYWLHFLAPHSEITSQSIQEARLLTTAQPIIWPLYTENLASTDELILFQQLIHSMKHSRWQTELLDTFTKTLLLSLSATTKQALSGTHESLDSPIIGFVSDWLQKNYAQPITVQEVANNFGYNKAYLSHLFSQKMGITMTHYLQQLRIAQAKLLLAESSQTITEISRAVGFQDEKYFSRLFKKLVACSPSDYRKSTQNRK
ncbi:hypothetical protein BAU15_10630 [Enterococcus sp. JM4C]|nr:hypothetical protein BAU15_10630 [Enterococcus sp. JM4C]